MDSEASVTALKVVFFAEILQLNERISCFARKCLAEPCQHPIHVIFSTQLSQYKSSGEGK